MPWELTIFDPKLEFDFGFDVDLSGLDHLSELNFFDHGHPIPPKSIPLCFAQRTTKTDYPDLFQGRSAFQMVMSARMRAVIEGVAPPAAELQFTPVLIKRPDGRPGPEGYSFFKVIGLVDSIIADRSEVTPQFHRGEFCRYDAWVGAKIAFRHDVVAGRHIWVDRHLDHRVFISDELRSAMMAAGLTGVATRPVDLD